MRFNRLLTRNDFPNIPVHVIINTLVINGADDGMQPQIRIQIFTDSCPAVAALFAFQIDELIGINAASFLPAPKQSDGSAQKSGCVYHQ